MKKYILSVFALGSCLAATSFADTVNIDHVLHRSFLTERKVTSLKSSHVLDLTNLISNGNYSLAVKDPATGVISFTRDGYFLQREDGYYYQKNKRLQGYLVPEELVSNACVLTDVKSPVGMVPARATSIITINQLNLNAADTIPANVPFNPTDVMSYNFGATAHIYDKLGEIHMLNMYFVKTSVNNWSVHIVIDDQAITVGNIEFNVTGTLKTYNGFDRITFVPKNNNAEQIIKIDPMNITQYYTQYVVYPMLVDGYQSGDPVEDAVDANGYISLRYTNNLEVTFSKIAVYNSSDKLSKVVS